MHIRQAATGILTQTRLKTIIVLFFTLAFSALLTGAAAPGTGAKNGAVTLIRGQVDRPAVRPAQSRILGPTYRPAPTNQAESGPVPEPSLFDRLTTSAKTYLGVPYRFGGSDPKRSLDCSAYVQLIFRSTGIELPRSTYGQIKAGNPVEFKDLQPGDLMFFSTDGPGPSHVAVYLGNGQMIHESPPRVQISKVAGIYREKFYAARRVLPQ